MWLNKKYFVSILFGLFTLSACSEPYTIDGTFKICKSNQKTFCVDNHLYDCSSNEITECPKGCNDSKGTCILDCDECPFGCNDSNTECNYTCKEDISTCKNKILYKCISSTNKIESQTCDLGCNIEGTDCAVCVVNKCENNNLSKCKANRTGYEEPTLCDHGCNDQNTDCDNSCTTDSCVGNQIYHCFEGKLTTVPENCPDIGDKPGSCANATACRQCDETQKRICVSPHEYALCNNGFWSDKTEACPDEQFCTADGCKVEMEKPCVNNNDGTGQMWTNINNVLTPKPCPNGASCKADGMECGECLSNVNTKCEDGVFYKCVDGQYTNTECPLGMGCHTVSSADKKIAACNECNHDKCAKSSATSEVGYITKCINGMWDDGDDNSGPCEASDGKYVSCQSETQCGECKNGDIRCKDENNTLICQNGKWVNGKCEGFDQICDTKTNKCIDNPNKCTPGEIACVPGDKDTPQTAYRECKEYSNGSTYWGPEIKCEGNTPICANKPGVGPACVQCDIAAKSVLFGELIQYNNGQPIIMIGGTKCDPNDERKQLLCLANDWIPKSSDNCSSDQICKDASVVALNEKGEYVTVYQAICAKK